MVLIHRANNESLPYPDEYFDCYISNLSLEHVENYKKQISESARVLQPKSFAGFSIPGRPDHSLMMSSIHEILAKHGFIKEIDYSKTHFYLSLDDQKLKKDFEEQGFENI